MSGPSSEDLELFRDLFIGARNAVVINGKKFLGDTTAYFFHDDLLRQHFTGEISVEAYLLKPLRWNLPDRFVISIDSTYSTNTEIVKAVVAEFAELGIKTYVERSHSRYAVRGFFEDTNKAYVSSDLHDFIVLPAWYVTQRVRLRLEQNVPFVIHPELFRGRSQEIFGKPEFAAEIFGGFLELPFAPSGGRFIDPVTMESYGDQWNFLRSIIRNPIKTLWDTHDVVKAAWVGRKDYDVLGHPLQKGRPSPACPYNGLAYAKLRFGHDEIYFSAWRRPGSGPYAVRRAYLQLGGLLREVLQGLKVKDLPAVRRDIERMIEALENRLPREASPELVLLMDEALAHIHRAIDALLQDKGLPPHRSLDFATEIRTA